MKKLLFTILFSFFWFSAFGKVLPPNFSKLQAISKQIREDPENPKLRKERGRILLDAGYINSAYDDLKIAESTLSEDPEINEMLFDILNACFTDDSYQIEFEQICRESSKEKTSVFLDRAIKAKNSDLDLWIKKSDFMFSIRDWDSFLEAANTVIRLKPDHKKSYLRITFYYRRTGDLQEEERYLILARKKFPNDPVFFDRLVELKISQKNIDEARKLIQQSVRKKENLALCRYYEGYILLQEEKIEEAIQSLKKSLEIDPKLLRSEMLLARVLFLSKRHKEAFPYLQSLYKQGANDLTFHSYLADYYLEKNRIFDAQRVLLQALSSPAMARLPTQQVTSFLYKLALVYEQLRRNENAVRIYELLLQSLPENPAINGNLGRIYYYQGDYEKAETYLKRSLNKRKSDNYRVILAEVLYRLKKYEEALQISSGMLEDKVAVVWNYAFQTNLYNDIGNYEKALGVVNRLRTLAPEPEEYARLEIRTLFNLQLFDQAETLIKNRLLKKKELSSSGSLGLQIRLGLLLARKGGEEAYQFLESLRATGDPNFLAFELFDFLDGKTDKNWDFGPDDRFKKIHRLIIDLDFAKAEQRILAESKKNKNSIRLRMLANFLTLSKQVFNPLPQEKLNLELPPRKVFEQRVQKSKNSKFRSWMRLMYVFFQQKEPKQSIPILQKAVSEFPQNYLAISQLAESYRFAEQFKKSEKYYLRYIKKFPKNTWAKVNLAICYDSLKEYKKVEKIYLSLKKKQPNNPLVLNNLAWLYLTAEDKNFNHYKIALEYSKKATRLSPNSYNFDTLAEAFYANGQYQKAVEAIDKALLHDLNNLDHFKIQKRKFERAFKQFQKKNQ